MTDDLDARRIRAAEVVLGLLPAADLREAEKDEAFAAEIAYWRRRFSDLDDMATPLPPDAALWQRIEASLQAPAAVPAPAARSGPWRGWWNSLPLWRFGTAALATALLLLAVAAGLDQPKTPAVIAVLLSPEGRAGAIVEAFADGSVKLVPITDIPVPSGKALQVWTLWDRARGPVPLGLLERNASAELRSASLPTPQPEQLYEITLEPASGSPTGQPTGPVLYKGLAAVPH
ncbi:anti-sigma factor [Zavarzinia compransoris]|uniref:Anti-sigma K factor RskA C-terminal domain-containing protein n=1 Tax=Zavarzinia compransoris TaxID=1264899 RepID=A0A317DUC9_9PROT|nr:anti-sigma factor [Zavarzinia compransoris]PWR17994.1 hypothetical protein DKG75_20855 [Zavarzinia compransoris]TDP43544.1 anti-sigma-K factor RskA [Zavarzinia compransoris]